MGGASVWFYVYGAAFGGSFGKLQRALIGRYRRLERVVADKPSELLHALRQMTIITAEFNKNVSECHGDSGSSVFLAIGRRGIPPKSRQAARGDRTQRRSANPGRISVTVSGHQAER